MSNYLELSKRVLESQFETISFGLNQRLKPSHRDFSDCFNEPSSVSLLKIDLLTIEETKIMKSLFVK